MYLIDEAKKVLQQLDPLFASRPVWILDPASEFINADFLALQALYGDDILASTSPVADIMAHRCLPYERSTGQRGFCMFIHKPLADLSAPLLSVVVHEASHYLALADCPSRDEPNEEQALSMWREESKRREPNDWHGPRWLRSVSHMAWRAMARCGAEIEFQELLEAYTPDPQALARSLRAEFLPFADEPIEDILETAEPSEFAEICNTLFPEYRNPQKAKAKLRESTAQRSQPASKPAKRPQQIISVLTRGPWSAGGFHIESTTTK